MGRTNVVIDDDLIAKAKACTGLKTKRAVIEEGLRTLILLHAQGGVRKLRGKLTWEGDLDELRALRVADVDR